MNNIDEIIFDTILKEAVHANFRARMDAMPSEEQLRKEYAPSPEHVRKMKKLFAWERRRDFTRKLIAITKAAAVALCVGVAILFSVLMFAPEVRAAVHGTIVRFFEGFTQVRFGESTPTDRTADSFSLGFIPGGYELISSEEVGDGIFEIYSDNDGNLLFFDIHPADSLASDTDHREYRTEIHFGVVFHILESSSNDYDSTVLWEQEGFIFVLIGRNTVDELLEMAFSLE